MLEKTLTPRQRGTYLVAAVLAFLLAACFAAAALQPLADGEFVKFFWVYAMATAVVLAVLAVLLFRAYWSGVIVQRPARGGPWVSVWRTSACWAGYSWWRPSTPPRSSAMTCGYWDWCC